jgi:hypothetical protein
MRYEPLQIADWGEHATMPAARTRAHSGPPPTPTAPPAATERPAHNRQRDTQQSLIISTSHKTVRNTVPGLTDMSASLAEGVAKHAPWHTLELGRHQRRNACLPDYKGLEGLKSQHVPRPQLNFLSTLLLHAMPATKLDLGALTMPPWLEKAQ